MASTYDNSLRLELIATGEAASTWGDKTNVNLTAIAAAFGYATQDGFAADANATTTVADGAADPARALYFKVTSSATLTATRTLTIAPNTISRVMWIENATTGGQSIAISQGTGANVTIPTGKTAVVYLDGAGAGAAVVDAMASLNIDGSISAGAATFSGAVGIGTSSPTTGLDVATTNYTFSGTTYDIYGLFGDTSGGIRLGADSSNDDSVIGTTGTNDLQFVTYNGSAWGSRMTLSNTGNVGIGTNAPSRALEVYGSAAGVIAITSNSTDGISSLSFGDTADDNAGRVNYLNASDDMLFYTATAERLRLDAAGNLGLGVVPSAWGSLWKVSEIGLGASFGGRTNGTQADIYENLYRDATNAYKYKTSAAASVYTQVVGGFYWANAGVGTAGATATVTQRMALTPAGTLCVGVTGPTNASSKIAIGLPTGGVAIETRPSNGNGYYGAIFYAQSGVTSGYIYVSATSTNFSQSSDYRLKEDAVPMTGATERVKALRPINFAWKVDGSRVDGFLAHEAQEVVPEAVHGSKDAMRDEEYEVTPAVEEVRDEDGNVTTEAVAAVMGTRSVPDYQGIDQSKLVPLLTATIQELIARIEALEGA